MSVLGRVRGIVVGPALSSRQAATEQITPVEGLSALSLDALTSVAYGPEAIMIVLAAAGAFPERLRYRLLHNQVDLVLAAELRHRPDVVVARVSMPIRPVGPPV